MILNILISSVNSKLDACTKHSSKSLINNTKRKGPRLLPCGTSDATMNSLNKDPPILTCKNLFKRYEFISDKAFLEIRKFPHKNTIVDLVKRLCRICSNNI